MLFPDVLPEIPSPPPILDPEHYEVIDGERVETTRMGAYETWLASLLLKRLAPVADAIGHAVVEMMFQLGSDGNKRRPDLAFVSFARWPRGRRVPSAETWDVVPDLAVEVISPSNTAADMVVKIDEFFAAGVRLVWVVYPVSQIVQVWSDGTTCRALRIGDDLDGADVVPGFRLALAELFEV